jgi:hypothetical protein
MAQVHPKNGNFLANVICEVIDSGNCQYLQMLEKPMFSKASWEEVFYLGVQKPS